MARKLIKKYLPAHEKIRQYKCLNLFGSVLHDSRLWHLNRRSARVATAVGLFWAWMPVPFQMVFATATAIPLRVNLPLSIILVWITNPLTMPFIYYFCYLLGTAVLQTPAEPFTFEASFEWLWHHFSSIGKPLITGCLLVSVITSISGYFMIDWLWRASVRKAQTERRMQRLALSD